MRITMEWVMHIFFIMVALVYADILFDNTADLTIVVINFVLMVISLGISAGFLGKIYCEAHKR